MMSQYPEIGQSPIPSTVLLVSLIANGYGLLTFGFIAVFVIPVLTIGVYKIINADKEACEP